VGDVAHVSALVHEFGPTFVLELGRGYGNSTAVFTEPSNRLGFQVVSIGFDSEHAWETMTAPKIRRFFGDSWFSRLGIVQADLTTLDLAALVADEERVVVFWDAHGEDVAQAVMRLLPELPPANLVVGHDVYDASGTDLPADLSLWSGPYASADEEVAYIWDYLDARGAGSHTRRLGLLCFRAEPYALPVYSTQSPSGPSAR
jgi:cephalosporin hydroxylase